MRYTSLGNTGMQVSNICLGTMMYGKRGNPDHEDGIRQIHAALDAGINFVDTADVYSFGESEIIVGKALKGRRDDVVLATKVHGQMGDDINHGGNSRRWIIREIEDSLKRLQTDYVDLYQVHRWRSESDYEETLSALSDLVHQGKVRAIGSSKFPAERIVEAQWTAERRGLERYRCEQPAYSIFVRSIERDVLPTCQRYGMGVITWGPLAAGWLTGRYLRPEDVDMTSNRAVFRPARFDLSVPGNLRKLDIVNELAKVADDAGLPLTHLALGFVLAHPAVTAAIIGPRTMEQLTDLLAAVDVQLDDATLDRIDEIVPPGTMVNEADTSVWPNEISDASLRRRSW